MRALYTATIFLGSALLFLVEPMVAKMILPVFGGSPEVWNTALVFFQGLLLVGYGYAHLSTRWLGAGRQAGIHLLVLLLPLISLPIALRSGFAPHGAANPTPMVLALLCVMVGLPFFVVSSGASLLQRWFAHTPDPHARDPYFLYSASNLGSMISLLAYPFLLEPQLRLAEQSRFWSIGYVILIVLMAACAIALWRAKPAEEATEEPKEPERPLTNKDRLRWVALAFIPSSLLLGVTTFMTTNLAPVPLFWVVPLALYLLTFIAAFAKGRRYKPPSIGRFMALLAIPLAIVVILEASEPKLIVFLIVLHLAFFLLAGLMCHGELSEQRPTAGHLTEFYFWISVGGVLGGAFNALLAPVLFKTLAEYPIAIVLACLARPRVETNQGAQASRLHSRAGVPPAPDGVSEPSKFSKLDWIFPVAVAVVTVGMVFFVRSGILPATRQLGPATTMMMIGLPVLLSFFAIDRPLRYGLSIGALFLVSNILSTSSDAPVLLTERSYFGVHRVLAPEITLPDHPAPVLYHRLVHGNTIHGLEGFAPDLKDEPLTYYTRSGPIGQVFKVFSGPKTKDRIALVGLGVGSLAAYGQPGQQMTYFEIDPVVERIATDPKLFTFIQDSKAKVNIVLGDGRLSLAQTVDRSWGIIVLDAFSSDAIPIHMLTRQAVEMYLEKLEPGGIIAFHISNQYLDLRPVLAKIADSEHLASRVQSDDFDVSDREKQRGKQPSIWLVMARSEADLGALANDPRWSKPEFGAKTPLWTDDFSNILSALIRDED